MGWKRCNSANGLLLLYYTFWQAIGRMREFMVWWVIAGNCFLSHKIDLWRANGAFGNCVADGVGRVYRKLLTIICLNKKSYKPVSRILSWAIIYLSRKLPSGLKLPTLQWSTEADRASSPQPLVYVAFQHARFTRLYCCQYRP
jgi:hypothetical protein